MPNSAEMRTELQDLQQELDVTTVYVTHDQTEAMTMGDRIAILNDGVLQQCATPLECYHEPTTSLSLSFIGEPSMNFFQTTLEGSTRNERVFDYELSDETVAAVEGTSDVTLGIRPEDIEVVPSDVGRTSSMRRSTSSSHAGTRTTAHLQFDESMDDQCIATVWRDETASCRPARQIRFAENAIHLFDTSSGSAIRNARSTRSKRSTVV